MVTRISRSVTIAVALSLAITSLVAGTAAASPALDTGFAGGVITPEVFAHEEAPQLARGVALQADGRVIVPMAIGAKSIRSNRGPVLRFNADGTPDRGYGDHGTAWVRVRGAAALALVSVSLQADGKALLLGVFARTDSRDELFFIARLTSRGTMDRSFGDRGAVQLKPAGGSDALPLSATALQDRNLLVAFYASTKTGLGLKLVRLNSNGQVDRKYANHGTKTISLKGSRSFGSVVAVHVNEKSIDALAYDDYNSHCFVYRSSLASHGGPVSSFGSSGRASLPWFKSSDDQTCQGFTPTIDGGVAVVGSYLDFRDDVPYHGFITRLQANGARDQAFGIDGTSLTTTPIDLTAVTQLDDGGFLISGSRPSLKNSSAAEGDILRVDATGNLVPSFGVNGILAVGKNEFQFRDQIAHNASGSVFAFTKAAGQNMTGSSIVKLTN